MITMKSCKLKCLVQDSHSETPHVEANKMKIEWWASNNDLSFSVSSKSFGKMRNRPFFDSESNFECFFLKHAEDKLCRDFKKSSRYVVLKKFRASWSVKTIFLKHEKKVCFRRRSGSTNAFHLAISCSFIETSSSSALRASTSSVLG